MNDDPPRTIKHPEITIRLSTPPAWAEEQDPLEDTRETEKAFSAPSPTARDRASLTVMSGPNAGQIFALDRVESIIGREFEAHVRFEDSSVSRKHARILRNGDAKYVLEDLGSTNGTYVGGRRTGRVELEPGDRIQLGPKYTLRFAITDADEEELQRQLFESSTRDPLTGAFNRKYLGERLAAEIAHARRHKTSLALILFDIDEFKRTNDTHGHAVGDAVLMGVAARVAPLIRLEDVFARYGGEEFVVLIRSNGAQDAVRLAERLRASIAQMALTVKEVSVSVTVSLGVASLLELAEEAGGRELIARADERLYRAKAEGKNRVCAGENSRISDSGVATPRS